MSCLHLQKFAAVFNTLHVTIHTSTNFYVIKKKNQTFFITTEHFILVLTLLSDVILIKQPTEVCLSGCTILKVLLWVQTPWTQLCPLWMMHTKKHLVNYLYKFLNIIIHIQIKQILQQSLKYRITIIYKLLNAILNTRLLLHKYLDYRLKMTCSWGSLG